MICQKNVVTQKACQQRNYMLLFHFRNIDLVTIIMNYYPLVNKIYQRTDILENTDIFHTAKNNKMQFFSFGRWTNLEPNNMREVEKQNKEYFKINVKTSVVLKTHNLTFSLSA